MPLAGRGTNSARWFEEHKSHGFKEQAKSGLPDVLKNYVCKCGKGLITAETPGKPTGPNPFKAMFGNDGPLGAG